MLTLTRSFGLVVALTTSAATAQTRLLEMVGPLGDGFAYTTQWAGDVNGDGHDDFWASSPWYRISPRSGRLSLHSGRDTTVLREFFGTLIDPLNGPYIVCGDLNGDNVSDLVVGDNYLNTGRYRALSGATGTLLYARVGTPGSMLGFSLASLGDLDGDNVRDFAVGAPGAGRTYVWSGRTGAQIREHVGPNVGDYYGSGLAAVGDIDGDGTDDLGIGTGVTGPSRVGFIHVMSGRTGALLLSFSEAPPPSSFGGRFAGIGDVDGDGRNDLAIGRGARFEIVSGRNGAVIRSHPYWQTSLAGGHDLDYDGVPDYLSGEWDPNNYSLSNGTLRIFSGRTGNTVATLRGDQPSDQLGRYIVLGGDINRDGVSEFITGSGFARQSSGLLLIFGRIPGSFQAFGTACAGSSGLPTIQIAPLPRVGASITVSATNVRPLQPGILAFGASNTSWGTQPLPAPLDALGMTGCTLWISPDLLEQVSTGLGIARWTAPIPNDVGLIGARFFNQFLLLDPGVNPLGVVASNASVCGIGG